MQPSLSRKRRKLGRSLALAGVVFAVGAMASPGCGSSGLVGGGCREGLTNCSNMCVNLDTNQYNCGHCGNVCQSGVACLQGKCGGGDEIGGAGYGGAGGDGNHYRDGSAGDALVSSDAQGDRINQFDVIYPQGGSTSTGGASSAGASNGGASGSDSGEMDACAPPYNDPLHCGNCTTVCTGTNVCAPSAGSYVCSPTCDLPLVPCNGTCVNLNSDPNNCGTCGNVCQSGTCQLNSSGVPKCVGVEPGHFVAICMNYRSAPGRQTTLLLGNSVFLPRLPNVRILAYDQYADP